MSEQEKQENQKTIVAFAAGLLIGGLLVWVFGGSPKADEVATDVSDTQKSGEEIELGTIEQTENDSKEATTDAKPEMQTGDGEIDVANQKAGSSVALNSATFPSDEGWVGVRDYVNGQSAGLLGVARYSKEQGLIPQSVVLQRPTQAGKTYAVVFYKESGDRKFSLTNDIQIEGVVSTFEAN